MATTRLINSYDTKSDKTAAQILSLGSSLSINSNISDFATWFAECLRWAALEHHDDMEVDAWMAVQQLENIEKRMKWLDILRGHLNAITAINEVSITQNT